MIKMEKENIVGFNDAIRGMRNPMNSWDKSDSAYQGPYVLIGDNDHDLMMRLAKAGPVEAKFRRMIAVYVDITAPLYWWKEFDTYKVGTVANSCSTMHKIHAKEFTLEDFSHDHLTEQSLDVLRHMIQHLNMHRTTYLTTSTKPTVNGTVLSDEACAKLKKDIWWQMIQLLPSSYNQKRTVMLNYEVLANIYQHRRNHKLDEWRELCKWIKGLPYSEIITWAVDEAERRSQEVAIAKALKDDGRDLADIARIMGYESESSIRSLLNKTDKE